VETVGGPTQAALYASLDLELSWSEDALPQVERTKHVHSLHPYLGKFIPQLVDVFLHRYFKKGQCLYDPFAGSGTALVEANVFGADAIGCDISAFNCLLCEVKTDHYAHASLEMSLRGALESARRQKPVSLRGASSWLRKWYAKRALQELLAYREAISNLDEPAASVGAVILSRAARSARQTTHFDLDFPRVPQMNPYWCHKHKRECSPVGEAQKFLSRYTSDTVRRLREFASIRSKRESTVIHADARSVVLPRSADGVITSPPYPGLIDYHEQHRYAYELLGLVDYSTIEIGAARGGRGKQALARYTDDMVAVLLNTRKYLEPNARIVIVVNDSRDLYPLILRESGIQLEQRVTRHVNRRTGRRAGEFFEDVLVCSAP
jgi:hypothetical protein